MNPAELIAEAERRGVRLEPRGDRLHLEAPSAPPPEFLDALKRHKPDVLSILAMRSTLGVEDVPGLRLEELNRLGLVVEVRSEVLGERILFAADAATVDPTERRPVYRVSELRRILEAQLSPESLRELHRVKATFGGRVTD